jgi:uncharacterized membrane protein
MFSFRELFAVFLIGGIGYGIIEILFRGYTHWSMLLTGGACFFLFYMINYTLPSNSLVVKCIIATIIITTFEFIVGYIVNIVFNLNVWDYSNMPYNVKGQICLGFSTIWLIFGIPMTLLSDALRKFFV